MNCFKFYRQSCTRTELKTVKDNPPSQHLTGNPLTFDRRLCPGARLGNLNLCLAGVGNLNRSAKRRFSRRVESHGRRFCLLRKSWVGHFNNFFPLGGGGEWRDMKKPIIKSESAPRFVRGRMLKMDNSKRENNWDLPVFIHASGPGSITKWGNIVQGHQKLVKSLKERLNRLSYFFSK